MALGAVIRPQLPLSPDPKSNVSEALKESPVTVPRASSINTTQQSDITASYQSQRAAFKNISTFAYPRGVGSNPETPHWLKIEVHVRAKNSQTISAFGGSSGVFHEKSITQIDPSSKTGAILTTGLMRGMAVAAVTSMAVTAYTAAVIATGGVALGALPGLMIVGSALLAGTAVGTAEKAVDVAQNGINSYNTLNSIIGLGLQESPKADYQTVWESQDLGEMMAKGGASAGGMFKEGTRTLAKGFAAIGSVVGLGGEQVVGAEEKRSGQVKNPYKEQLFKQVEYRTFNYTFKFLPESASESKDILSMMQMLRTTMLPSLDPNGFYLIYPAEYSLTYMYRGAQNTQVSGIGTCALLDMKTTYGGEDFVVFQGTGGSPAEMSMSLTFKEIVPLTADQVFAQGL